MNDTLARILAGLALVGLLINGVLTWRANSRLATVQERLDQIREKRSEAVDLLTGLAKNPGPVAPKVTPVPVRKKAKGKGKGKAKGKGKRRDPELREERRKERVERRTDKVRSTMEVELTAFADEYDVSDDVLNEVLDEIMLLREGSVMIREDMREDRISVFEGRAELVAMREDSDARLAEILGDDLAKTLRKRFADGMESRRNEKAP